MPKIKRSVLINGTKRWISADTEQEYAEKLFAMREPQQIERKPRIKKHKFADYALNWFEVYSRPHIATATANSYQTQIGVYLLPAFGERYIEDITPDDIQQMFNSVNAAKTSKNKIRTVLNQIFDAAVDDDILTRNPLSSRKIKVDGSESRSTEPYTLEQMKYIISNLSNVQSRQDRTYLALQALHPMRLEEVLGLKWSDIDFENRSIYIRRAVTHPTRNAPEIKLPKTRSSVRKIGLSSIALKYLQPGDDDEFVVSGRVPLSYTQVRGMCRRIQRDINFEENITPIRFRTTVLTDLYDQTKDIKLAQAAAGHTTSAMTLKYYVKGRSESVQSAAAVDNVYGG